MATTFPPLTYDEAIDDLVKGYVDGNNEFGDLEIYLIPDPSQKVVRLIQVSDAFPNTNEVWPITLRSSADFPYKSSIAIATKDEWNRILSGRLAFGAEWDLSARKRVWPHD